MIAWQTVGILAALFATIGASFDRLLPFRLKGRLQYRFIELWNKLDDTKIPDLFALTAGAIVKQIDRTSRRPLVLLFLYSFGTFVFLGIGSLWTYNAFSEANIVRIHVPGLTNVKPESIFDTIPLPHVVSYVALFPFDLIAFAITIAILRRIAPKKGLRNLGLILLLLSITILSMFGGFAAVHYGNSIAVNHNLIGTRYERHRLEVMEPAIFNWALKSNAPFRTWIESSITPTGQTPRELSSNAVTKAWRYTDSYADILRKTPKAMWHLLRRGHADWERWHYGEILDEISTDKVIFTYTRGDFENLNWPSLFLTGTISFPILSVLLLLTILVVGKLVLQSTRALGMYFLDLTTESKPTEFAPGALSGIVLGVVLAIMKAATEIWALFRH